jgi:hypothetical protein
MGFVHYGAVIIAYYEAVHCLFGHHKFWLKFTAQVYEKCIVEQFIRDWSLKTCLAAKCILRGPGKREI